MIYFTHSDGINHPRGPRGCYSEALGLDEHWSRDIRDTGPRFQRAAYALLQINLAEALYNMGRWSEAWNRLIDLDEAAALQPISRNGLAVQRAWILAHYGKAEEAWEYARAIRREGIPPTYWTEIHYTRSMALLALGRVSDARAEVHRGLKIAKRASSRRNGIFLLGRLAAHEGQDEEAIRWFEEGAALRYRAQGGEALLLWGDVLQRVGRENQALAAWKLTEERDPESESARIAAERLRAATSSATTGDQGVTRKSASRAP